MKNFTEDFMLHNLSKRVIDFIRELEQPHRNSNKLDLSGHLERLYRTGEFSKQDYLFAKARVLLNRFCYEVEEHIGRGAMTGFLFYCQDRKLLCYGAGANYPQKLKEYCVRQPPSLDLETDLHYKDEVFRLDDIEDWPEDHDDHGFLPVYRASGVKSGLSKRMRLNGFTFGTFEVYFDHYDRVTDEELLYIREKLQPLKEKLYHIREEMIEALDHTIDRMGLENFTNNKARFLSVATGGFALSLLEILPSVM
ncbi:hypothetical protein ACSU64_27805 [Bacillaceae bacterium C204]|uniref:hypothetical protein n=1 Tax=Neobacillus sp. 204 TaxID=3383351 RepID=UPI00397E3A61